MDIGDKIHTLRISLGLTLEDVGNAVGVGKSTVRKWEVGDIANMRRDKIAALAKVLQTTPAYLMGWEDETAPLPSNILPLPKTRKVPLLGTIACGEPILATENIAAFLDVAEEIHCDFALRCKGDSMMDARILDGDVVYIRHQPDVENGEIAAVLIDGMETEATLKRVYKSEGQLMLTPANAAYAPRVFIGEDIARVRILGKAVAFASLVR